MEAVAQTINIAKEYEEAARGFIDKQVKTFGKKMKIKLAPLAWENSRRLASSPLEPSQNDVWVTSAETAPYWWRVSTQI